jgi:hypothetical protein
MDSEVKPVPLAPSMDETAPSKDSSAPANTPATILAAAPATAPAIKAKPVESGPDCGHQPTKRWPDESTAIIDNITTYKRYDDNM